MTIYVSANTEMTGDGTKMRPFKSIQEAAEAAGPGDVVLVADGIYREHVAPVRSGTAQAPVTYRAMHTGRALVTGAELLDAWELTGDRDASGGAVYRMRMPNGVFGDYNPFSTLLQGDWIQMREPLHTALVFFDDRPLREVSSLSLVLSPPHDPFTMETYPPAGYWTAAVGQEETVITANFQGQDPSKHRVEATVRRNLFMPLTNGVDYITVSGFSFTKAATQWAPPTAYQDGAVGPHWSRGWVIEDCEISHSRCCGISLGKYLQPENENKWTNRHVKHGTQTERDAVCRAVADGWTKERIGSHTVRGCDIHDCGQAGIVGHLGGAFSVIADNHIHHINNRRDISGAEIAGIKLHAAIDTQIERNHIHHCTRGLWLDWQAQGTRVSCNFLHDNMPFSGDTKEAAFGEDLFIEVSHGPTLVDNNVLLSAHAAKLATQGVAFVHNLIAGAFTCVGRGTDNRAVRFPSERYTPYHMPHSTQIAGFMTILHGDMRFYNNIFVQKYPLQDAPVMTAASGAENGPERDERLAGTKPYDGYPTPEAYFAQFRDGESMQQDRDRFYDHLPVTAAGNCYFGGAEPCDIEKDPYVDRQHAVTLDIRENPDGIRLVTDLYTYLPANRCSIINTQTLGEAFEPEQRFEAPDGTALVFRGDYHGKHRGVYPVCGPFEVDANHAGRIYLTKRFVMGTAPDAEEETGNTEKVVTKLSDELRESIEAAVDRFFGAGASEAEKEADEKPEPEEPGPSTVDANLVMVGCEACTFALGGASFTVREIYIRGNEVWMTSVEQPEEAVHLDCEYGYFKRETDPELRAPFLVDVSEDRNLMGIVNTIATMYRILTKSMVQDPQTVCERIRDKANETLEPAGISMRFTPQHLKFIKKRRFITLEEVIDTVGRPEQHIVAEIVTD